MIKKLIFLDIEVFNIFFFFFFCNMDKIKYVEIFETFSILNIFQRFLCTTLEFRKHRVCRSN